MEKNGVNCAVQDAENSNGIEFEILKIVFFIVTYLLITDGVNVTDTSDMSKFSSFYNTLFIFSASTWVDYLSTLRFQKKKRHYDGKGVGDSYVPLIGSIIGIFTVSISMYCVCEKSAELLPVALKVYYASLSYIFLKAFLISSMVIRKLVN